MRGDVAERRIHAAADRRGQLVDFAGGVGEAAGNSAGRAHDAFVEARSALFDGVAQSRFALFQRHFEHAGRCSDRGADGGCLFVERIAELANAVRNRVGNVAMAGREHAAHFVDAGVDRDIELRMTALQHGCEAFLAVADRTGERIFVVAKNAFQVVDIGRHGLGGHGNRLRQKVFRLGMAGGEDRGSLFEVVRKHRLGAVDAVLDGARGLVEAGGEQLLRARDCRFEAGDRLARTFREGRVDALQTCLDRASRTAGAFGERGLHAGDTVIERAAQRVGGDPDRKLQACFAFVERAGNAVGPRVMTVSMELRRSSNARSKASSCAISEFESCAVPSVMMVAMRSSPPTSASSSVAARVLNSELKLLRA